MDNNFQLVPFKFLFSFAGKIFYKLPENVAYMINQEAVCLNDGSLGSEYLLDEKGIVLLPDLLARLMELCSHQQRHEQEFKDIMPGQFYWSENTLFFRTEGVRYLESTWLSLRLLDGNFGFRDVIAIGRQQFEKKPVYAIDVDLNAIMKSQKEA